METSGHYHWKPLPIDRTKVVKLVYQSKDGKNSEQCFHFLGIYLHTKPWPWCRALRYSALVTCRRLHTFLWSHLRPSSLSTSSSCKPMRVIWHVCTGTKLVESKNLMYMWQAITQYWARCPFPCTSIKVCPQLSNILQLHALKDPCSSTYDRCWSLCTLLDIVMFKVKQTLAPAEFQISAQLQRAMPKKWNSGSFTSLVPYSARHLHVGYLSYKNMDIWLLKCISVCFSNMEYSTASSALPMLIFPLWKSLRIMT